MGSVSSITGDAMKALPDILTEENLIELVGNDWYKYKSQFKNKCSKDNTIPKELYLEILENANQNRTSLQNQWYIKSRHFENFYHMGQNPIGWGQFAEVFIGMRKSAKESTPVAIKRISRKNVKDSLLRKEVDIMLHISKLQCENLVKIHDAFLDDKYLYLILDLCQGGELFDHVVEQGPYSTKLANELVQELVHAIKILHENNIVHRDLKPENCLLTSTEDDAILKVADFGLSAIKGDFGLVTGKHGTMEYRAPEVQVNGIYTDAVDIWSLGIIVYIILSGYHPFDPSGDASREAIQSRVKKGNFNFDDPVWENISKEAKDLVCRMICVDPALRIKMQEILEHPWIADYHKESHRHLRHHHSFITNPIRFKKYIEQRSLNRKTTGAFLAVVTSRYLIHKDK